MTKQEEIREGFAAHLLSYMIPHYKNSPELSGMVINELFNYLHSQGVVIKVAEISDDLARTASETPKYFAYGKDMAFISTERTFHIYEAFKKAGYAAVEPLIQEVKNDSVNRQDGA